MQDNKELAIPFSFTLQFKVGGIVDSTLAKDETLEKLHAELSAFYGDDGYEIVDFREATADEVETYKKYIDGTDLEDFDTEDAPIN